MRAQSSLTHSIRIALQAGTCFAALGIATESAAVPPAGYALAPIKPASGTSAAALTLWSEVPTDVQIGVTDATLADTNRAGQWAGWALTAGGQPRAVLWDEVQGRRDPTAPLEPVASRALGIGNDGTVVGAMTRNPGDMPQPFAWNPASGLATLPLPEGRTGGEARDVNAQGLIVGAANSGPGLESVAVLWQDGKPYDLNELVHEVANSSTGIQLTAATAIADDGRITVTGRNAGSTPTNLTLELIPIVTDAPAAPLIDRIAEDSCINARESELTGIRIEGRALPSAQVIVTFANLTYFTAASSGGSWAVTVAPSVLRLLTDGSVLVTAAQRDSSGQESPANRQTVLRDTVPPPNVSYIPDLVPSNDSGLSNTDNVTRLTSLRFEGQMVPGVPYVQLFVGANPGNFGSVSSSGFWHATTVVPPPGGNVAAAAADRCRNAGALSDALAVHVDTVSPSLTVAKVSGDRLLNASETATGLTVGGTATVGDTVSVSLSQGGIGYSRQGVSAGTWSLQFAPVELAAFAEGRVVVGVQAIDLAGNTTKTSTSMTKDTRVSIPTIRVVAGNDVISVVEAEEPLDISGTADAQSRVRMTIGNVAQEAAVGADGLWSVRLSSAFVRALPTGELQVNATSKDKAGNISANASRTVIKQ